VLHICNVVIWVQWLLHRYWLLLRIVLLADILASKRALCSRLWSSFISLVLSSKGELASYTRLLLRCLLLEVVLWQLILNILDQLGLLSRNALRLKSVLVDFNMGDVGLFASKTEFLLLELLLGNSLLVTTFHLFDSVSVTNGVKSILAAGVGRRNVGNHGGL
jgi:hypothetical protein